MVVARQTYTADLINVDFYFDIYNKYIYFDIYNKF